MKKADITGQKFNMLTAIKPTEKRCSEGILWLCKCDCGNECYVSAKSLRNGNTKSCGCLKAKKDDITGQRFGRLTAIKPVEIKKGKSTEWLCKCDCGKEVTVEIRLLRSDNTRSCGCYNQEVATNKANTIFNRINGTMIEMLKSKKIPTNNTSGVKGVSWNKQKQKWEAYINFKGKKYRLGFYKELSDAAAARKEAEEKYHDAFVEWYEKTYGKEKGMDQKKEGLD